MCQRPVLARLSRPTPRPANGNGVRAPQHEGSDTAEVLVLHPSRRAEPPLPTVEALECRFRDLGLHVRRRPFRWWGRQLFNLEAEHRVAVADTTVLITAHLDSTASSGDFVDANGEPRPYDPAVDPAPGADDDGSGTAGVLAADECLAALVADGEQPTRKVRFVLFNAEEQGLVGSKFYARAAAAQGDRSPGSSRWT